ncbi:MAG: hypothetical protein ACKN9T_01675 [Candidatus Methylumidiphilus sp.]
MKTLDKFDKTAFAVLLLLAPALALADTSARDTAITAAFAAGNTSVTTVIAGVLGLVALGTGMTLIIQWLRK